MRAGFVVCAYLVLACGLTVDDALSSFEAARPPGVRHEKFVDELRRRYDSPKGVEEAAAPSRSSMGSLRSDMATVAEFLDSGPGLEALSGQALHGWAPAGICCCVRPHWCLIAACGTMRQQACRVEAKGSELGCRPCHRKGLGSQHLLCCGRACPARPEHGRPGTHAAIECWARCSLPALFMP